MIKIGIVDDEENARRVIKKYLERYCEVEYQIVFETTSFQETIDKTIKFQPNILFLDIHLLDGSGIDVAQKLSDESLYSNIIFTTAYNEYAISALRLKAFDYLLKPIEIAEFKDSLNKVINFIQSQSLDVPISDKISITSLSGVQLIELATIEYIKAESSYCTIQLTDKKSITISKPLKYLETKVNNNLIFIKIHKSYLVNKNLVHSLDRTTREVILFDGIRLPISRSNLKFVFDFFKI